MEKSDDAPTDTFVKEIPKEEWTLFTDGSSCTNGSGAGLILTSPEGTEFTYALRFQFTASNNKAEYEALIVGLRIAAQIGVRHIQANVESKLVANQVLGAYVAKEENMVKYLEKTNSLVSGFDSFSISHVSRSKNKKADALSKIASTSFAHLSKQVLVEILNEKSINGKEVATVVEEEEPTWMTPIVLFLETMATILLANHAPRYVGDTIHKCKDCQIHRPVPREPQQPLTPITAPWPFYKWGIDIAGPFPEGPRKVKFLIVAMDYFTKWIEAKAVATISAIRLGQTSAVQQARGAGNRSLGEGIKARLDENNKNWLKELPHLRLNLDLVEERHERATIREAQAKLKMKRYYDARVKNVAFRPGDFVYRSNDASHAVEGGKLSPKWEGPYEVLDALGDGAYKLRSSDGTVLPRTWNVTNLKKCYL
ncbi:reverse transcriptase domain-containing protein [Tanacetum coccineum]